MMFQSIFIICFDGLVMVPGPVPLLVVTNKLKQDLKKEQIGDSKRRARCLDSHPVFGAKSGSGWEGKRTFQQFCWHRMLGSGKAEKKTNGSNEAAMRSSNASRRTGLKPWGRGRGRGKPFPRGFREEYLPLNHLSPKGWWDFETNYDELPNVVMCWISMFFGVNLFLKRWYFYFGVIGEF